MTFVCLLQGGKKNLEKKQVINLPVVMEASPLLLWKHAGFRCFPGPDWILMRRILETRRADFIFFFFSEFFHETLIDS